MNNKPYAFCAQWTMAGYLDAGVVCVGNYRDCFNAACSEFELSYNAAKQLKLSGIVAVGNQNSNFPSNLENTLYAVFIRPMTEQEYNTYQETIDLEWDF